MSRLVKLLRLDHDDRRLLAEAALLLAVIRLALAFVPFTRVRKSLARISRNRPRSHVVAPARAAWAVQLASRYVPGTSHCLTRALAGQLMLARSGIPARLRIGLARGEQGRLHGHAWLESDGEILIGGQEASDYTALSSFEGALDD